MKLPTKAHHGDTSNRRVARDQGQVVCLFDYFDSKNVHNIVLFYLL